MALRAPKGHTVLDKMGDCSNRVRKRQWASSIGKLIRTIRFCRKFSFGAESAMLFFQEW